MKRLFIFLVMLAILVLAASYLLIPRQMLISKTLVMGANFAGSSRLLQEKNWEKWWPSQQRIQDSFYYRKYIYFPTKKEDDNYQVLIKNERVTLNSTLQLMPAGDSTELKWQTRMDMGTGPLTRIGNYIRARTVSKNLGDLTLSIKNYLEDPQHIYGFKIERTKIPSVHLVAINASYARYPQPAEIYGHINEIKTYIETTEGRMTGDPVLNVTELSNRGYQAMIGVPVDREIAVQGKMFVKRMVTANALTTKVKGGAVTTRQAMSALYNYLHDYKLVSPEIPFETLVTDRTSEPDTAKWETHVFLPVL